MRNFYRSSWFIWLLAVMVMAFTGTFNAATLIVLILIALVLLGGVPPRGE